MNDFVELRRVLATAIRWWWLLILSTVMAATAGYVISLQQTPVYEATTTVIVGQFIQATKLNRDDILTSEVLIQTYADIARRQPVLQSVVDTLDLSDAWTALKSRVSVSLKEGTQLLQISVEAGSPEEARVIADEVTRQLILLSPTAAQDQEMDKNRQVARQRLEKLQARIEAGQQRLQSLEAVMAGAISAQKMKDLQIEFNNLENLITQWENNHTELQIFIGTEISPNSLTVVEPAQASSNAVRPRPQLNAIVAGAVGLALALGLIFLLEFMDNTLKGADEVSQYLDLTVLGIISRIKGKHYQDKLITVQETSAVVEAYRMIRSKIEFLNIDEPTKSIIVTSAGEGEGKSITVANLGIIMAQADLRTIIVDADLRQPVQHRIFQVSNSSGLTELLRSPELELGSQLRATKVANLQLLTSGGLSPNPAELLRSQRMRQLLANLTELADVVIFDSPPAIMFTDAAILSNRADGVVLVIDAGKTQRDAARQAILNLRQAKANFLGSILNRVSNKRWDYHYRPYERTHSERKRAGQPAFSK